MWRNPGIYLLLILSAGYLYSQTRIPLLGVGGRKDLVKTNAVISFRHLTNLTDSGNQAEYATAAFTPTANALVIAAVVTSDTVVPDSHVLTSLHGTWYQISETPFNTLAAGLNRLSVWYCKASATSSTLTNKFTGAATGCIICAFEFNGTDMTTPTGVNAVRQAAIQAIDVTASPSHTLGAAMQQDGRNATVAILGVGGVNPASITNEVNWTSIADIGYNTPSTGLFATYRLASVDSSITFTNNSTSNRASMILEVRVER